MTGFLILLSIVLNIAGIVISFINDIDGYMLGFIIGVCEECNIIGKICMPIIITAAFPVAVIIELLFRFIIWLFTVGKK